ncbi:MAG: methylenetetrahydrofolate--tRNA-(uracil(54)-C(5))-methyltransferase (FADH(2)-oxidizing) TrmFO [Deltaproteobacteria bacterium]|nr:methylenetetrahydrofolate--tRNA-(uracil(54)-C(5))-methyltransferase (FADH(2)-oxidizing) TrmFO [Deltaproteobacteria bacterium]
MASQTPAVTVVGGGLAGCEAALHLAHRGIPVRLYEMRPARRSPAHASDELGELVCSSSLGATALTGASGLLKEELARAGSALMRCADQTRVPAGGALAVDRRRFAVAMTGLVAAHERIEIVRREVARIPDERPAIVATGPLTSDALCESLAQAVGAEHLFYYDAIAPIVSAESIDWSVCWKQSRYDKGGADYVNCPLDETQYRAFVAALLAAEKVAPRPFEEPVYFEGCLPCEVMAERGVETLAHGPLKPVGLTDPRAGRRPYAVLQLRAEDEAASAFNLVGMQTRMKHGEQKRVFRMVPGLGGAEFLRLGSVHRNTFLNAPELLDETMQLRALPGVYVAGQLTGVEGYVESAAGGLLCAVTLAQRLRGEPVRPPPATTALGGLLGYLRRRQPAYQPSNITWAHLPPLEEGDRRLRKRARYQKVAERALMELDSWLHEAGLGGRSAAEPRRGYE